MPSTTCQSKQQCRLIQFVHDGLSRTDNLEEPTVDPLPLNAKKQLRPSLPCRYGASPGKADDAVV